MTPITHGLIGWITATPLSERKDRYLVTLAGIAPDIDGIGALIDIEYYSRYHHIIAHNLIFGIILALFSMLISANKKLTSLLVFVSFNLHILGDLLGSGAGWGVSYLWPLNNQSFEFIPPYQWELDSWQNFIATALCIIIIITISLKKKITIVELFNKKVDQKIVTVFNQWFGKK
jgi:membrane-bound metal-dependent hydrolase YbcI (DUF457 family)